MPPGHLREASENPSNAGALLRHHPFLLLSRRISCTTCHTLGRDQGLSSLLSSLEAILKQVQANELLLR